METKGAVKFLEVLQSLKITAQTGNKITINKEILQSIIELLKRGEKHEKMWGELEKEYGREHHFYAIFNERGCTGNEVIVLLNETMKELQQKYFPKEE